MIPHMRKYVPEAIQCANGCHELALPNSRWCRACRDANYSKSPLSDLDNPESLPIGTVKRTERMGAVACLICGRPSPRGRMFCSSACRYIDRQQGGVKITIDGITATIREHADRVGVNRVTVSRRLSWGCSLEEAFHRPMGRFPKYGAPSDANADSC